MDPSDIASIGAGMIQDNAVRHLLFVTVALLFLAAAGTLAIAFSEKAFGFSTRGAIDDLERLLKEGNSAAVAGVCALMGTIVICGAWIAVTVIRP